MEKRFVILDIEYVLVPGEYSQTEYLMGIIEEIQSIPGVGLVSVVDDGSVDHPENSSEI
jgi:hypothetical protein